MNDNKLGVRFRVVAKCLMFTASRLTSRYTAPPVHWAPTVQLTLCVSRLRMRGAMPPWRCT